jgi:hypothetical protein
MAGSVDHDGAFGYSVFKRVSGDVSSGWIATPETYHCDRALRPGDIVELRDGRFVVEDAQGNARGLGSVFVKLTGFAARRA